MKIRVITNENICAVNEEILSLAHTKFSPTAVIVPTLIIVPDRFTLQAEKILMRNVKSMLNIRVLTFSMLYNLVKEELTMDDAMESPVLDKTTAVLFMWRAIRAVRDDLMYFGRSVEQYAFAEKMFNTINQLTSCMADFDNLEKNAGGDVTKRKMHDIQIIYAKYRELTKDYTDSSRMLGWLIENVSKSKIIKSARVFITGFEYLSVQRAEVVRALVATSAEFTAGTRGSSEFADFINEIRFAAGAQ